MSTDSNSQPNQDDVFAASQPFANAGDGFVAVDAFDPGGPRVISSPFGRSPAETSCASVLNSLSRYLDGELGAAEAAAVQHHLGICGACQTAQAFQMQLRSRVAATKALDPMPDDVRARITKALGFE